VEFVGVMRAFGTASPQPVMNAGDMLMLTALT
jgi:hypothetical protein